MRTPTIVKTTKDYMLIRVPLPQRREVHFPPVRPKGHLNQAEKRLWKIIQEGEQDLREGRTITAPSIKEALRRYAKRQWD